MKFIVHYSKLNSVTGLHKKAASPISLDFHHSVISFGFSACPSRPHSIARSLQTAPGQIPFFHHAYDIQRFYHIPYTFIVLFRIAVCKPNVIVKNCQSGRESLPYARYSNHLPSPSKRPAQLISVVDPATAGAPYSRMISAR